MEFNFKKFENRHGRYENRITVTKSNSIGFPSKFYSDNKINDYKFVVLYWDLDKKAIGINFTNEDSGKSNFSIVHSKLGYGGTVAAKSFFTHNNINTKEYYGRYEWTKFDQADVGTLFVISLKKRAE